MNLRPQDMAKALKRMGIAQVDIPATEVIIRCDDKDIIIQEPNITKVNMMGQETYQIVGKSIERTKNTAPDISPEDIATVVEQTGTNEEQARKAIEHHKGDLAAAIIDLKKT